MAGLVTDAVGISAEALLVLLALALYLFDASLFFARDEAALVCGRGGRWFARFGLDRWRLSGREPYLPNPFTPHRPLFRLHWRFDAPAGGAPDAAALRPVAVPDELRRLSPHVLLSGACLFVMLPVALFYPLGLGPTCVVVGLLYANNVVALWRLYRRRSAFGLTPSQVGSLAFECLACPPFAVNLIRRLCARLAADEDFQAAAERLLRPEELAHAHAECLRRVDEQIDYELDGTPRMAALRLGRQRFAGAAEP